MGATPVSTWLFFAALGLGSVLGLGALFESPSLEAELDDAAGHEAPDGEGLATGASADFWSLLGVGRVPLGLLVSLDLLLVGGIGLVASELFAAVLPLRLASWLAAAAALLGGPMLGARLGQSVARRVPNFETYGARRRALIGRSGRTDTEVDACSGRARVRDAGGALHLIRCVVRGPVIPAGSAIVVIDLDATRGVYEVEHADRLFAGENARPRPSSSFT
jgi:hypothetical protein